MFAVVSTTQVASALARLILSGDAELVSTVADYGRALAEGETVTEAHRQGMARAVAQRIVVGHYVEATETAPAADRARLLRQTALYVHLRGGVHA